MVFTYMNGSEVELVMNVKILKNGENNCVEVNRMNGDCMIFFEQFNTLKDYIGEMVDESV